MILIFITFNFIIKQLKIDFILIIIYINLFLFYEYIIKFSITKEKRLIIDIITIK